MSPTFNPDKYQELLCKYQPKLIKTEAENERALAIVEELMHRPNLSLEEDELYSLLVTLIEKFEREYYSPGRSSTPASILLFLMEQRDLEATDLIDLLGSETTIAEILEGKREFNSQQSQALGAFFQVDPALFYPTNA
ncbi:helix-turn-helix domain-containing protein [Merismopedia glauca]|uniref:Transcriptional regulator n=1 Tax=Merismopedia glauca CCAP 1448/3 TaxID=1296344 RepID=A0A2T1BZR1_9CYAN|nr:transcriptional regulator [Merismopedia glauca]PSB01407.1 transcriptional regulator [Merismopedia glauca CCAP 1448/3]